MFKDNVIYISINGIDMEFEAWQLIRLFFDEDKIKFIHNDEEITDFSSGCLLVLRFYKEDKGFLYRACFTDNIPSFEILNKALKSELEPQLSIENVIAQEELSLPGGSLLKNRKIIAGTLIYKALRSVTGKSLPYGSLTGVRPVKLAMKCLEEGMDKQSTAKLLTRATGMNEEKAHLLYDIAKIEAPYAKANKNIVHLYIGIPFCLSRCLYCSFTSYPMDRFDSLVKPYLQALEKEILFVSQWIKSEGLKIGSTYIGGGTPTSIDTLSLDKLLNLLKNSFEIKNSEFSVEAGRPDTITIDKLRVMLKNGVSRISINPQTMNKGTLEVIGRNHTPEDIEEKFLMAREMGFNNINMDIIAGLPGENLDMFRHTLNRIEALAPESLTVHTMAVKRASRLFDEKNNYVISQNDIVEAMVEEARSLALKMGLRPYYLYRQKNMLANLENIGYAKPGLECVYNIQTMEERQTVIAMGAGSISKFVFPDEDRIERVDNVRELSQYTGRIDEMLDKKRRMFNAYLRPR